MTSRKGREGQDRSDKVVPSRFYLAISDVRALVRLASSYILVPSLCPLIIYQLVTRSALTTCCQKWTVTQMAIALIEIEPPMLT